MSYIIVLLVHLYSDCVESDTCGTGIPTDSHHHCVIFPYKLGAVSPLSRYTVVTRLTISRR